MKSAKNSINAYIAGQRFGGGFGDAEDILSSDSEEEDYMDAQFGSGDKEGTEPSSLKSSLQMVENKRKKLAKLSPCATYMTLIKGFTCVAILYLP